MTFSEFKQSLSASALAPLYLFYGTEDFFIDEGIHAIIELAVTPEMKGFNLDVVYGNKVDAKEVIAHATSFPMMSERRVVVVKEFEKLLIGDTDREIISAYINNPLLSTCFVLVTAEKDFRKKPFNELKKKAVLIECKPFFDNQVPPWIRERIRIAGRQITPEACQLLHAYVGNSLRALQNEIDKLFIFIGERKEITPEDVASVVGATKGFTIFELQNAIGRKDTREAVRILERMLEMGQSPQYIIIMLTKFFTQLWKLYDPAMRRLSEYELEKEFNLPPSILKQYLLFRTKYSSEEIEHSFSALLDADTILKTTSRDPHLVLDLVIITCTTGERAADYSHS
ncbi:MAG: DNA polymerase III subunit delta [bacterium]